MVSEYVHIQLVENLAREIRKTGRRGNEFIPQCWAAHCFRDSPQVEGTLLSNRVTFPVIHSHGVFGLSENHSDSYHFRAKFSFVRQSF